ncbi:MAG: cation-transporting P-type ATPase [Gammaproteobacteria bacterium]
MNSTVETDTNITPRNWHSLEPARVCELLETSDKGLTASEVKQRTEQYGQNKLTPPKRRTALRRFLEQFNNVLILVLIGAIIVTAILQHWLDSAVITGVVIINAIIGFIQEGKAESALEAIRSLLSPQSSVLRDGKEISLPSEQLVPGDIVLLQSGDRVPADMRIIKQRNLKIDESILTGESVPVDKNTNAVSESALLADRTCVAYSGTMVTFGTATGVITGTGDNTEIGKISSMLGSVEALTTPLVRQMAVFSKWLTFFILVIAIATLLFGYYFRDYSLSEMFLAAVGLAVAAIPEGLPAIMTITLAIGVKRMAGRNAIIRRLPAVETLGSVTVICSDKTGTLTRNEMTATHVATADRLYRIEGVGYEPHGGCYADNELVDALDDTNFHTLLQASALCNDANLHQVNGTFSIQGDPTEAALLVLAQKSGIDTDLLRKEIPRNDEIPFESEYRFMATLHHDHDNHAFIYLKGAPEKVLDMCHSQLLGEETQPIDKDYWHKQINQLARDGERPLAIAIHRLDDHLSELSFSHVENGLTMIGIVGITDPPRQEAIEAIKRCTAAGIQVKMITGDHASTAQAISEQLGINHQNVITGNDMETMSDDDLKQVVLQTSVFARANPEHKLRLVQALQSHRHVVAMTGDGVNDAPALKRADIGIAMGQKGTEVAKETAEMVLADDNFASITNAVEEGRTVYDNIRKSIMYILPTNAGEAVMIIVSIMMGITLPITPVQILWINMVTAVTLALSLSFEPAETKVMQRPPRAPGTPLLDRFLVWRIFYVFSIMLAGAFGLFLYMLEIGHSVDFSRTVAVNTIVMFEVFYLLNVRYLYASTLSLEGLFGNRYVVLAIVLVILLQLAFTYLPIMQTLFNSIAIDIKTWGLVVLVASSVLVLVEFEKWVLRRFSPAT